MHSILVRDYMQAAPVSFQADTNLLQVVDQLLAAKVSGAPVIDSEKRVIGFISEQDCIKEILQGAFYCEDPPVAAKVMSTQVLSFGPDASIVEVAQIIIEQRPKNYPVIDNGKLVGMITRREVLMALLENDEDCYLRHG